MKQYRAAVIPQVPGKPFHTRPVSSHAEARNLAEELALFQLFALAERVMPDYSNAVWVEVFVNGEWEDADDEDADEDPPDVDTSPGGHDFVSDAALMNPEPGPYEQLYEDR